MTLGGTSPDSQRTYPRSLYVLVGLLTGAVLVYTVAEQIFDANLQVLWEAIAMLAGDHPYRDFYLTGWPLQTVLSAIMLWLLGNRLIGEFLIHWSFILAGVLIGFHLALRLSRSVAASLAAILVTILALVPAATVHFPKLFFYPLAVLVASRYLDRPGPRQAAMAGAVTAMAFLFRHDHGVYIGVAFVFTFVLARVAVASSRTVPAIVRDAGAYAAAATLILAPWALVVHLSEGLADFARTRAEWGGVWAVPPGSPFDVLWDINPLRLLPWGNAESGPLSREQGLLWLVQITLLLPMLVLGSVGLDLLAWIRRGRPTAPDTSATIVAAGLALFAAARLIREESYYVVLLPLSAALGARLLAGRPLDAPSTAWTRRGWRLAQRTLAVGVLLITSIAAAAYLDRDLLSRNELDEVGSTYRQLLSSPPIDAYQPAADAREVDWAAWQEANSDARQKIMIRYMYDCTRADDRLLVTGSTPYHVGYFAERRIAGGQLQWHHRWRSDPVYEEQALALIRGQSVPFAFSTHDPVFEDFRAYPRIHAYLTDHYVEVEGTGGLLLVDTRRQPTGRFGRLGFPCFR